MPTWSHDGQWLYFSWQTAGARDIWRVHLTRGVRERVTRGGGGLVGRESMDGRAVYFQRDTHDTALLAQPLAGGPPRTVFPCVTGTAYAVTSRGIYYVPCGDARSPDARLFDPVTGADHAVVRLVDYQYSAHALGLRGLSRWTQSVLRSMDQSRRRSDAARGVQIAARYGQKPPLFASRALSAAARRYAREAPRHVGRSRRSNIWLIDQR